MNRPADTATAIINAFQLSLTRFFDYLPQLVGAIIILIIGYFIARVLQTAVRRILRRMRFDRALHTAPAGHYIARVVESPSILAGQLTFWAIFLVFISFAVSALDVQVLNYILNGVYAYIPRVIIAIIIFLVASAVSAGAAAFIQRVLGRTPLSRIMAAVVPTLTLSIATFMILDELQIASTIVTITYGAIMGAVALGLALAFGLGGRDLARTVLDQAYTATQRTTGTIRSEAARSRNTRRVEETEA